MDAEKRKGLLTDTERERLANRDEIDAKIRANTYLKSRKKLTTWCWSIPDIEFMLYNMPPEHIINIVDDDSIFRLLEVVEKLLSIKGFSTITGEIDNAENWTNQYGGDVVTDLDIYRAYIIFTHINRLQKNHLGHNHPFTDFETILELSKNEKFMARVKPEERKGFERIAQAIIACEGKFPREFPRDTSQLLIDVFDAFLHPPEEREEEIN